MSGQEHIVNGLRDGDHEVIKKVYKDYFGMIKHFVSKNSGSETDAEDLFQDAMYVVYTNFNQASFKLTVKFKTYLYSVCRNLWLSELNKRGRNLRKIKDYERHVEVQGEFDTHWKERKEERYDQVARAMRILGDKCKEILVMFYFKKLSMQEIAVELNYTNADTVKTQKYKCIRQLKYGLKL